MTRKEATAQSVAEADFAPVETPVEAPIESPVESVVEPVVEAAAEAPQAATETVETIAAAADKVIDAVTERQQEALQAIETAKATMMENVTRAQRAIAEFVSTRIREDIETQQQLLRCKSFDEFRNLQSRYFATAVEQYGAEASRMFRLSSEIVTKASGRTA